VRKAGLKRMSRKLKILKRQKVIQRLRIVPRRILE
jgi:hypothetical protein